ncbi:MAG: hypothetical protein WBX95_14350 [Xanthobacteraceae bacterium]
MARRRPRQRSPPPAAAKTQNEIRRVSLRRRSIPSLASRARVEVTTLVLERAPEGKICVTSGFWEDEKVFLRDQALEVRNAEGRLHLAREERQPDEWNPEIAS